MGYGEVLAVRALSGAAGGGVAGPVLEEQPANVAACPAFEANRSAGEFIFGRGG